MGTCLPFASLNATFAHITNICNVAFKQGRFTWRHNSVLFQIATTLKSLAAEDTEVFSDLPSFKVNGTTIPADILVCTGEGSKPDLEILNRGRKTIALLELTCPLPRNTTKAHPLEDKNIPN